MPNTAHDFGLCSRPKATGIDLALRSLLSKLIRSCSKTRAQIAQELSDLTGQRITVHMLNDFTAESKGNARFPAAFIRPLCEILDSDEIVLAITRPRLRKQIEFSERVGELRRLCDELLGAQKPNVKQRERDA